MKEIFDNHQLKEEIFIYCCDSVDFCPLKEGLEEGFLVKEEDDLYYKFRVSFIAIRNIFTCYFKMYSKSEESLPLLQEACFNELEDAIAFCNTPFFMLDISEVNILWYQNKTTQTNAQKDVALWEKSCRRKT